MYAIIVFKCGRQSSDWRDLLIKDYFREASREEHMMKNALNVKMIKIGTSLKMLWVFRAETD